jgi:small subunit ribosomal protein S27Ae
LGKKKVSPKVWTFYKIEGDRLVRLRRECPRCGKGVFLAKHKDRLHCGRCGYTEFITRKPL